MKPGLMLILFLLLLQTHPRSQHQNHNWYFGQNAGVTFNTSPPSTIQSEMVAGEGNATISDPIGQLLFYTNGITVWDRNHDTMPNGTGLLGGYSSTQSALIVPFPFSKSKYYLFTAQDAVGSNSKLSYSIVDMELNNGLGDIQAETKNTLILTRIGEKVTSVLHANGHDIWVITHTRYSSDFYAYHVSSSGLNMIPVISTIGSIHKNTGVGPIKPSHHGDKILISGINTNLVELFDFNNTNGTLSNPINISALLPPTSKIYGIEFSPNDSLFYLSSSEGNNDLFQIDIATLDTIILNPSAFANIYGALQLGPDNKIYMARSAIDFIDIIHHPDQKGLNCEYDDQAITFAENILSLHGLPSHCLYSFFLPNTQILGKDTILCAGETLELNIDISKDCAPIEIMWDDGSTDFHRTIDQPGTYWVQIESICGNVTDTIQVDIVSCTSIVHYTLDSCQSYISNGTNMDYSEFIPSYPELLPCTDINSSNVSRSSPQENKHSCTPGVNGSIAMCISSHASCTYEAGHIASLIFEVQINPYPDSVVILSGLEFFEKAPAMYTWINGPSGDNNYPTLYGLRILKNGNEIFRKEEINTSPNWTLQSFDFLHDTSFRVNEPSLFRFELLPYCPAGNGAQVSAWDVEDIRIFGGCVISHVPNAAITGKVIHKTGVGIGHIEMQLSADSSFAHEITRLTDAAGQYSFSDIEHGNGYHLRGYKNDDVRNGVSAIDLILIQKHLLGLTPFTSLHQYIAADINRNGKVSAADLVLLQKLLLGHIQEFPKNQSWRFGYMPQDMTGQDIHAFDEVYHFEYLDHGLHTVDFIGIKIGDINGDAKL